MSNERFRGICIALALLAVVAPLASARAADGDQISIAGVADPEQGALEAGAYVNRYFGLSFPLPPGWAETLAGPRPSESGVYALGFFEPTNGTPGSISIVAQDLFFAVKPADTALAAVEETRREIAATDGMSIDRDPSEVTIAGRPFARLDFSGAGLYRALFATTMRCHLLSFVVTTPDADQRDKLVLGLAAMTLTADTAFPICRKDYASGSAVIRKVEPPGGAEYARIPVRILVGADGRVRHIHVIRAAPALKSGIEEALTQWLFKPYETNGSAVPVETGVMFELRPAAGSPQKAR